MDRLLLTEPQAVAYLQLSRTTLRRLEEEGKLKSLRIGRSVRYLPSELERFVKELST